MRTRTIEDPETTKYLITLCIIFTLIECVDARVKVADLTSIRLVAQCLWDSTDGPRASPLPRCPLPTSNCHGSEFIQYEFTCFFFPDFFFYLKLPVVLCLSLCTAWWKLLTNAENKILILTWWCDFRPLFWGGDLTFSSHVELTAEVISSHDGSQCRFSHWAECKAGQLVQIVTQSCFKYRFLR